MKTKYQKEIISRTRELREKKGLSQNNIAKSLGMSRGQMGDIESPNFTHKYTLEQLYSLCKMFDYPIQRLFCGIENPSYPDFVEALIKYQKGENG